MFRNFFSTFKQSRRAMPLFLGSLGLGLSQYHQQKFNNGPQCCGIIGVLSTRNNAEKIIQEGIELLQNRGYDSAGVATLKRDQKEYILTKLASDTLNKVDCIEKLHEVTPLKHKGSFAGIGHTRWATCGGKTDENSHPHFDQDNRIMLCHNGTLDNFQEMRKQLLDKGVKLSSQTDSELIAQLIGLQCNEGLSVFQATSKVVTEQIQGQWGLVILDRDDPDKIIVARNGSPILVGLHEDTIFIASEKIAFEKYTENYINVGDGEVLELSLSNRQNFFMNNKKRINKIKEKTDVLRVPKEPFKYFFEQEIYDQPETLLKTLGFGSRLAGRGDCTKLGGLESHVSQITDIENMVIIACGSSYYASQFASHYFKQLRCFNAITCIEGSEFTEYDVPMGKGGIICVSQSGETADIRKGLEMCTKEGVFSIGVINTIGSQIAQSVNCGVYLNCGREVAVAATKSFTSQILALILVAVWISYHKDHQTDDTKFKQKRMNIISGLRQIPLAVGQTLGVIDQPCKEMAQNLYKESSLIVLGKGPCSSIAKEGALKLKELTYIHAEAFSAGELKHGPLALIDPDRPKSTGIILLILDDEYFHEMSLALSEVKSRNALSVVITDCPHKLELDKVDHCIEIPSIGYITPLLCVLPLQKLTHEICMLKQTNPDKPRNLAKCVTVK